MPRTNSMEAGQSSGKPNATYLIPYRSMVTQLPLPMSWPGLQCSSVLLKRHSLSNQYCPSIDQPDRYQTWNFPPPQFADDGAI